MERDVGKATDGPHNAIHARRYEQYNTRMKYQMNHKDFDDWQDGKPTM